MKTFQTSARSDKRRFIEERITEALSQMPKESLASLNVILEEVPIFWLKTKSRIKILIKNIKEKI